MKNVRDDMDRSGFAVAVGNTEMFATWEFDRNELV